MDYLNGGTWKLVGDQYETTCCRQDETTSEQVCDADD
jgi:hypothetical protein